MFPKAIFGGKSGGGGTSPRAPTVTSPRPPSLSSSSPSTTPTTSTTTISSTSSPTIGPIMPEEGSASASEGESEWDFESITKSLEGYSSYKDLSLREKRIVQYLQQRSGTLRRGIPGGGQKERPTIINDMIQIDAEIEKIRKDIEERKESSDEGSEEEEEEDEEAGEEEEDEEEEEGLTGESSTASLSDSEMGEQERMRQKNLRAKLAAMSWGSESEEEEGEGEEEDEEEEKEKEIEGERGEGGGVGDEGKPEADGKEKRQSPQEEGKERDAKIENPSRSTLEADAPVASSQQQQPQRPPHLQQQQQQQQQPSSEEGLLQPSIARESEKPLESAHIIAAGIQNNNATTATNTDRDGKGMKGEGGKDVLPLASLGESGEGGGGGGQEEKRQEKERIAAEDEQSSLKSGKSNRKGSVAQRWKKNNQRRRRGLTESESAKPTRAAKAKKTPSASKGTPSSKTKKQVTTTVNPLKVPLLQISSPGIADKAGLRGSGTFSTPRYATAIELFASSPRKSIQWMIDQKYLVDNPKDIARFLCTDKLDRTKLGEYISDLGNEQILKAFCKLIDFKFLDFDLALRRFLYRFRLPGEAQKIDRLMNAFARQYHKHNQQNPAHIFRNADAVYVLAFSVIMLNTDAHNPKIKKKMTLKEFMHNNQGINDGQDFAAEVLEDLYNRIIFDEIRFGDDAKLLYPHAVRKGWLYIKTIGSNSVSPRRLRSPRDKDKGWTRHWCLLSHDASKKDEIHYFSDMKLNLLVGSISTMYYKYAVLSKQDADKVVEESSRDKLKKTIAGLCFFHLKARDGTHSYIIGAATEAERDGWIRLLSRYNRFRKSPSSPSINSSTEYLHV